MFGSRDSVLLVARPGTETVERGRTSSIENKVRRFRNFKLFGKGEGYTDVIVMKFHEICS